MRFKRRNCVWLITREVYALNMLVVRVYYMNNSLVVVVPSGRVRSFVFVFVFVHTMIDDDGTRRRRRYTTPTSRRRETRRGTSRDESTHANA